MPLSLPVISYFMDCSVQQEVCHSAACLGFILKIKNKIGRGPRTWMPLLQSFTANLNFHSDAADGNAQNLFRTFMLM